VSTQTALRLSPRLGKWLLWTALGLIAGLIAVPPVVVLGPSVVVLFWWAVTELFLGESDLALQIRPWLGHVAVGASIITAAIALEVHRRYAEERKG